MTPLILMDYRPRTPECSKPCCTEWHPRLPKVKTGRAWRDTRRYHDQPQRIIDRYVHKIADRVLRQVCTPIVVAYSAKLHCGEKAMRSAFNVRNFFEPVLLMGERVGFRRMRQLILDAVKNRAA